MLELRRESRSSELSPVSMGSIPRGRAEDQRRIEKMNIQSYHGVSATTHQTQVTNLSKAGYGMISLSVYGDPGDAQYAAVWVDRPMASWSAIHGVSGDPY